MRRLMSAAVLVALGATAVWAENLAVIKERHDHFEALGKAVKAPGAMFKGEEAFDLAKVQAALKLIEEKAPLLVKLFPDDSKTGGKTEALPAIWADKADFESRFAKIAEAAKAAQVTIKDEASFPEAWKGVVGNCGGCHKIYRKPKS